MVALYETGSQKCVLAATQTENIQLSWVMQRTVLGRSALQERHRTLHMSAPNSSLCLSGSCLSQPCKATCMLLQFPLAAAATAVATAAAAACASAAAAAPAVLASP
jgi:hypothetical protein